MPVSASARQVAGASLPQGTATRLLEHAPAALGAATRISDGKTEYVALAHPLFDVEQHRVGKGSSFTRKYKIDRLVWFQEFANVREAKQREKAMKEWPRAWRSI